MSALVIALDICKFNFDVLIMITGWVERKPGVRILIYSYFRYVSMHSFSVVSIHHYNCLVILLFLVYVLVMEYADLFGF